MCSTDRVTRAWREDDAPQPLSVYGASKLAGENEIRGAGGAFLIVRTLLGLCRRRAKISCAPLRGWRASAAELRIVADQIGAPTSAALIGDVVAGMLSGGLDTLRERCTRSGGARSPGGVGRDELARLCLRHRRGAESPRRQACGRTDRADQHR